MDASDRTADATQLKTVLSQKFVRRGSDSYRSAVIVDGEGSPPAPAPAADEDWHEDRDQIDDLYGKTEAEIPENNLSEQNDEKGSDPWLEGMGWAKYLMGENRRELKAMLDHADPETEQLLNEICRRFDFIVEEARNMIMHVNMVSSWT